MGANSAVVMVVYAFRFSLGICCFFFFASAWSSLRYRQNAAVGTRMARMMMSAMYEWSSSDRVGGVLGGGGVIASGFCAMLTESRSMSAGAPYSSLIRSELLDMSVSSDTSWLAPDWSSAPAVVVMAPTRELAIQIHHEARRLVFDDAPAQGYRPPRAVVVYGGADAKGQLRELAKGCDILVATPVHLFLIYLPMLELFKMQLLLTILSL